MPDEKMKMTNHKKQGEKRKNRLIYHVSLFVLSCFLIFLCCNVLTDWDGANYFFETQPRAFLAMLVISTAVFLWLFFRAAHLFLRRQSARRVRCVSALLLLAAFSLQLVFLLHYRNFYLFDNAFVTGGASTLATDGMVAAEARYYVSVYPNQNAYLVLTAVLWKVGSFLGMSRSMVPYLLNGVNLICLDMAFFILYKMYCLCLKDSGPADRGCMILLICMNPFLYIGVCYYYTIVLSMPFFMLLLYLFLKHFYYAEKTSKQAALLLGVVFSMGYLLRATTVIPMIAILFVSLYFRRWKKEIFVTLFTAAVCIALIGKCNADYIGIDTTDTAFPALHWVMMSMTPPGSHNEADEAYTASFDTKAQKQDAVRMRLKEKLQNMSAADMAYLFVSKVKNTWGDGSNGYTVYLENCAETDGLYEWVFGQHKDGCLLYHQGYYLLLMLLFLRHIFSGMKRADEAAYLWQLTYLGGILFYLLWETSAQYSLPFLPVLMLGGGVSFTKLCEQEKQKMNMQKVSAKRMKAKETVDEKIEAEKKAKENTKVKIKKDVIEALPVLSAVICFSFLLLFFVCNIAAFTKESREWTHPVVTQILANDEVRLRAGELFTQTFETDQPFNRIIFQYSNPNANSEAVCEAALFHEGGTCLMQREINLKEAPARNAAIYDFETIIPQGKQKYSLQIRMTDGGKNDEIGIITYSMGHYDAYPDGVCLLGQTELETDMLMAVSNRRLGPYMTPRQYLFAGIILFLPIFGILLYTIRAFRQARMHGAV